MKSAIGYPLLAICLFAWLPLPSVAADKAPAGRFANAECVDCHAQRAPELVIGWKASSHARKAPKADCVVCHGATHGNSAARARRDDACTGCHEKLSREVVHSYATSKHATLLKLEKPRYDWSRPLARGNYRAPGCAYCHLHAGEHNTAKAVAPWDPYADPGEAAAPARTAMQGVCGGCHAPRYVAEQFGVGNRMTDVARMKLREGRDLVAAHPANAALAAQIDAMHRHGRNVRLGAGHQSPDYQWWHGQPAIDGDLLRIKSIVSGIGRASGPKEETKP